MKSLALAPVLVATFIAVAACAHSVDDGTQADVGPTKPMPAGACSIELPKEGLCAAITWEQEPSDSVKGSFLLKFTSPSGQPAAPSLTVAVKLWMPTMGHGSSPVTITKLDASTYRVSDVYFVMPGRWEIHVLLKNGSVVAEDAIQLYDAHD